MPSLPKHGHGWPKKSRTYLSWQEMKRRCRNPKAPWFELYGGRGISVCERWDKFENFLADMGERPDGRTLERIESNGNYEPGNCRWATPGEQNRNTSRNIWVDVDGERLCVRDWATRLGLSWASVRGRLRRGWDPVRAVTEPAHEVGRRLSRWRSPS